MTFKHTNDTARRAEPKPLTMDEIIAQYKASIEYRLKTKEWAFEIIREAQKLRG